jgi:DNA-directed RNA polymerase subunit RPC12/RpoP
LLFCSLSGFFSAKNQNLVSYNNEVNSMKKTKKNKRKGFDIPGMKHMRCPYCGSAVHLRSANGIYKNNKENTLLYVCSSHPVCDAYVRVHPGTTVPVGSLANAKLRALRVTAHQYFDKLHQTGLISKDEAYGWLAFILQLPRSQAHIGYQSEYFCNRIIEESEKFFDNLNRNKNNIRHEPDMRGGERYAAQ